MNRLLKNSLLFVLVPLMAACAEGMVYNHSADIDLQGWTPADSLFFALEVNDSSRYSVEMDTASLYRMDIAVRHTQAYSYTTVPLSIIVERQLDSISWTSVEKWHTQLPMTDNQLKLDGNTWGSFYQKEVMLSDMLLHFDSVGAYRIVILPDTTLTDIASISIELNRTIQ